VADLREKALAENSDNIIHSYNIIGTTDGVQRQLLTNHFPRTISITATGFHTSYYMSLCIVHRRGSKV